MAALDTEIEFLLQINRGEVSDEERKDNTNAISGFRTEYFALMERKTEKETEMADTANRHAEQRAGEMAADEAEYAVK